MSKFFHSADHTVTDEALCLLASQGDRKSEEALIVRYTQLVRCYSRRLFLMGADPEDLLQEGMIGLFRAIHRYDPERGASFKTFASRCIDRRMQSAIRDASAAKHAPLNSALSLDDEPSEWITYTDDPELRLLDNDAFQERLQSYKSKLSAFENQVLDLYLQGFTRQEIAEGISSPVKSVDNALQRIRSKLRS